MKRFPIWCVIVFNVLNAVVCAANEPAPLTAEEVLRRWEQATLVTATATYELEYRITAPHRHDERIDHHLRATRIYREDGGRFKSIMRQWGIAPTPNVKRDPAKEHIIETLLDPGQDRYKAIVLQTSANRGLSAEVHKNLHLFEGFPYSHDGVLDGFVGTGWDRTSTFLLKERATLALREGMEEVDGRPCHVVTARSKFGHYTLWIDPQRSFHLARARLEQGRGHWIAPGHAFPQMIPIADDGGRTSCLAVAQLTTVDHVRFILVGERWVPSGAVVTNTFTLDDQFSLRLIGAYERRHIDIAPDFEKLKPFELVIPEGTPVAFEGSFPVRFIWRNGRPEALDREGI